MAPPLQRSSARAGVTEGPGGSRREGDSSAGASTVTSDLPALTHNWGDLTADIPGEHPWTSCLLQVGRSSSALHY